MDTVQDGSAYPSVLGSPLIFRPLAGAGCTPFMKSSTKTLLTMWMSNGAYRVRGAARSPVVGQSERNKCLVVTVFERNKCLVVTVFELFRTFRISINV